MNIPRILHQLLASVLLLSFVLGVTPASATAQDTAPAAAFDLQTDADANGLPDALEAEVQRIEGIATSMQSASTSEADQFSSLAAALGEMDQKLPYSAQTRVLQGKLNQLQAAYMEAGDESTALGIRQEMDAVEAALWQDSNYRTVIQSLEKMLIDPQTGLAPVKPVSAYRFHQYLPAVASGGEAFTATGADEAKTAQLGVSSTEATQGVSWSQLWRGDVMLVRSGWLPWNAFVYCMWYCHAGVYDGNNFVYESNTDGVRLKALSQWKKSGQYVGLAYNRYTSYSQDRAALDWAKGKWRTNGTTKYNYAFWDKGTDSKLYCSQLVWKINKRNNYDLDSNNWTYLMWVYARWNYAGYATVWYAVAPDEVARDGDLYIYSGAWN